MLTLTKIKTWASVVPTNVGAIISSYISKLDFSYMTLNEDNHVYTSTKNPDIEWTSVTTLIKTYEPAQDWDEISKRYGRKNGIQPHVVKAMWEYNADCAAATGSTCHLFGELICNIMVQSMLENWDEVDTLIEGFKRVFPFQLKNDTFLPCMIGQNHIIEFWEKIISEQNRWPVAAECIVDDPEKKVCGTVDLLMLESDLTLSMWDYKTSKKLDNPYARSQKIYMLREYANMVKEPLSEYTIQLAIYKNMLAKHGINIGCTNIIHVPNTEDSELAIVPVNTDKVMVL